MNHLHLKFQNIKICIKSFKNMKNIYKRVGPSLEKNENVLKNNLEKYDNIY